MSVIMKKIDFRVMGQFFIVSYVKFEYLQIENHRLQHLKTDKHSHTLITYVMLKKSF